MNLNISSYPLSTVSCCGRFCVTQWSMPNQLLAGKKLKPWQASLTGHTCAICSSDIQRLEFRWRCSEHCPWDTRCVVWAWKNWTISCILPSSSSVLCWIFDNALFFLILMCLITLAAGALACELRADLLRIRQGHVSTLLRESLESSDSGLKKSIDGAPPSPTNDEFGHSSLAAFFLNAILRHLHASG